MLPKEKYFDSGLPEFSGSSTPLTPEQREQALVVAREFVTEADRLLEGKDQETRIDTQGRRIVLSGENHIRTVITRFKGAQCVAFYYEHPYQGGIYSKQYLFAFYPDRVDYHVRSLREKIFEANAQELTELLDAVKGSKRWGR